ncbi:hypothetical protein PG997_013549 [Apiospora hydei]|uniref:Ankyrin n=1 Tax=Apiospora hydei TaxID=1337664 RepID=A0ABR1V790_9PEZI
MASFADLPPELLRPIIEYAVLVREGEIPRSYTHVGLCAILRLREVNKVFDAEVLAAVARLEIFRRLARNTRAIPWYETPWDPPRTGEEPAVTSETRFLARYLLGRPHAPEDRWDANLSAYLNTLLDLVLAAEGSPAADDDEGRLAYMLCLCRHYMGVRLAQARERMWGWAFEWPAAMYSVPDLFNRTISTFASGPLERHLLACQSVIDASAGGLTSAFHADPDFAPWLRDKDKRGSQPLGDSLRAFILGSTMDRFVAVLDPIRGVGFNDDERDCLVWAVQSGQLAKVKYMMSWPGHRSHQPFGDKFERAVVEAVRLRRRDMVAYLFGLHRWTGRLCAWIPVHARSVDVTTMALLLACRHGDLETVRLYFRYMPEAEFARQHPHLRRNALMYACRSGNPELVSFLLSRESTTTVTEGVVEGSENDSRCRTCNNGTQSLSEDGYQTCCGEEGGFGPIFVAATNGNTRIAQLVLDAGRPVSAIQYQKAAAVAVELGHDRFLQWILEHAGPELTEPTAEFDLLGLTCVRGSVRTLEVLAANGLLQDRLLWAEDCCLPYRLEGNARVYPQRRYEKPALVAMVWKRDDILQYLLARGFEGVADPLETSVKDGWREGWIPRRPTPKVKPFGWRGIESVTLEQKDEMLFKGVYIF